MTLEMSVKLFIPKEEKAKTCHMAQLSYWL